MARERWRPSLTVAVNPHVTRDGCGSGSRQANHDTGFISLDKQYMAATCPKLGAVFRKTSSYGRAKIARQGLEGLNRLYH